MIIQVLGVGGWQIALIVTLAMSTALLLDQGNLLVTQAAVQAIVVATLLPYPGAAFSRWTDAVIGGGVALVAAAVVPRAPLRRPREQAGVIVRKISALLRAAAESILDGDVDRALEVLARRPGHRRADRRAPRGRRRGALGGAVLAVPAPAPWAGAGDGRAGRAARLRAAQHPRAGHGGSRWLPTGTSRSRRRTPRMLDDLANLTDAIADELRAGRAATAVRDRLIDLGRETAHVERTRDLSAEVILAQVRSLIADLLAVTGMDPLAATDQIPLVPE